MPVLGLLTRHLEVFVESHLHKGEEVLIALHERPYPVPIIHEVLVDLEAHCRFHTLSEEVTHLSFMQIHLYHDARDDGLQVIHFVFFVESLDLRANYKLSFVSRVELKVQVELFKVLVQSNQGIGGVFDILSIHSLTFQVFLLSSNFYELIWVFLIWYEHNEVGKGL